MKSARSFDIAIAGGGLAGLALALALARDGAASVVLIDRSPLDPEGCTGDVRASALTAASRNLLSAIGVWKEIEKDAQPIVEVEITDSALDEAYRPVFLSFASVLPTGEAGAWMVENERLRRALLRAARKMSTIAFAPHAAVERAEFGGSRAKIFLSRGDTIRARLMIAADGRRSALRAAAGIKTLSWTYPQTAIVTTVTHERPHRGKAVQHFLPAGPFAILPLTKNRSSLVWTERRDAAAALLAADDPGFLAELTRRFGHQLGALALKGTRVAHPLDFVLARSLVAPRLALLGDAARGVHPLAGQGFNMALKDVAALTECATDAMRLGLDPGADETLTRYERWRRFDSALHALGMDAMNRLFSTSSRPTRIIRDLGLGIVNRIPPLKAALVGEAAGITGEVPRLLRSEGAQPAEGDDGAPSSSSGRASSRSMIGTPSRIG